LSGCAAGAWERGPEGALKRPKRDPEWTLKGPGTDPQRARKGPGFDGGGARRRWGGVGRALQAERLTGLRVAAWRACLSLFALMGVHGAPARDLRYYTNKFLTVKKEAGF
jgi:hypothetical protein